MEQLGTTRIIHTACLLMMAILEVASGNKRGQKFTCHSIKGDFTPLSLRRFFESAREDDLLESIHSLYQVTLSEDNRTLSIQPDNTSQWPNHKGLYKCITDHGYSWVKNIVYLSVELPATGPPPPVADEEVGILLLLVSLLAFVLYLHLISRLIIWFVTKLNSANGPHQER